MVNDRNGFALAVGDDAFVAGEVQLIVGTDVVVVAGTTPIKCNANDVARADKLATTDALAAHIAATTAHGAVGDVVGTENAQLLENKTLESPTLNEANAAGTRILNVDTPVDPGDAANKAYVDAAINALRDELSV